MKTVLATISIVKYLFKLTNDRTRLFLWTRLGVRKEIRWFILNLYVNPLKDVLMN